MGNDIFMGGIKFVPDFDNMGTEDQWYDFVGGAGKIQIGVAYQPSTASFFLLDPVQEVLTRATGPIINH